MTSGKRREATKIWAILQMVMDNFLGWRSLFFPTYVKFSTIFWHANLESASLKLLLTHYSLVLLIYTPENMGFSEGRDKQQWGIMGLKIIFSYNVSWNYNTNVCTFALIFMNKDTRGTTNFCENQGKRNVLMRIVYYGES